MKNYLYLLIISFSVVSCYTYKTNAEKETAPKNTKLVPAESDEIAKKEIANLQANPSSIDSKNARKLKPEKANTSTPKATNIQEILDVNKYFKIEVGSKSYKIQVDKWESDTLVAHVIHKPKKILKFHKNQINQSTIAERRFSQPIADIMTVVAYAAVGVGIWALVK